MNTKKKNRKTLLLEFPKGIYFSLIHLIKSNQLTKKHVVFFFFSFFILPKTAKILVSLMPVGTPYLVCGLTLETPRP